MHIVKQISDGLLGGVLFTCLFESSKREVLAAGGRYDALIEENRPIATGQFTGRLEWLR